MVLICGECSPGGAHPTFNLQIDYDKHREKAHGEPRPEIIIGAPALDKIDNPEGFVLAVDARFNDVEAQTAKIPALASRLDLHTEQLIAVENRTTELEAQAKLCAAALENFNARITALEQNATAPAAAAAEIPILDASGAPAVDNSRVRRSR